MILGIGAATSSGRTAAAGTAAPAARSRFVVGGQAPPGSPAPATAAAEVSLSGLLSLQEALTERERDEQARTHAAAILAELAALQRILLEQGDAADCAETLKSMLARLPAATDPALIAAIRLVALRARIEAARHERR